MDLELRAQWHAALGNPHRLLIADELLLGDRTVRELADSAGIAGNLLAHHLNVLERAGLIERRVSGSDQRRRYVVLRRHRLAGILPRRPLRTGSVLFVCTHNSARSQFAAAWWRHRTGRLADSAGSHPAARIHAKAVRVAAELGVDLSGAVPKGYESVAAQPALVVSVCDRAAEAGIPFSTARLHWSVPDPVQAGRLEAFRSAFTEIADRINGLVVATEDR